MSGPTQCAWLSHCICGVSTVIHGMITHTRKFKQYVTLLSHAHTSTRICWPVIHSLTVTRTTCLVPRQYRYLLNNTAGPRTSLWQAKSPTFALTIKGKMTLYFLHLTSLIVNVTLQKHPPQKNYKVGQSPLRVKNLGGTVPPPKSKP